MIEKNMGKKKKTKEGLVYYAKDLDLSRSQDKDIQDWIDMVDKAFHNVRIQIEENIRQMEKHDSYIEEKFKTKSNNE